MTYVNAVAQIYKDIFNWLDTKVLDDTNNPMFHTRAVFNNQIERSKRGSNYSFWDPSVFVEIKSENEGDFGSQLTYANLRVTFHISMFQTDSMDGNLDQNLYIFHLRDIIKAKFSLFEPSQCGPFNWGGEEQQFDHDQIYTYKLHYNCFYIDKVAEPEVSGAQYEFSGAGLSFSVIYATGSTGSTY